VEIAMSTGRVTDNDDECQWALNYSALLKTHYIVCLYLAR